MTFTAENYRQFAHDSLNVLGRIESVAELAELEDETLQRMLNNDVATMTRAVKLFSKLGWCENQKDVPDATRVDASALLYEVVAADRPEGVLLSIDENIMLQTNQAVFRAVLEELVHNVAAHSVGDAPAKITLGKTSRGYTLELKNPIETMPPENMDSLFVKGEGSKGMGIGLAMVASACKLMEMDITHEVVDNNRFVTKLALKV